MGDHPHDLAVAEPDVDRRVLLDVDPAQVTRWARGGGIDQRNAELIMMTRGDADLIVQTGLT